MWSWCALGFAMCAGCGFELHLVGDAAAIDGSVDDSRVIDARADAALDAAGCTTTLCEAQGGACRNDSCVIDTPSGAVACPVGGECSIECSGDNSSCRTSITCPAFTSCDVQCSEDHTCDATAVLTCATGSTCEVFCKGDHACSPLTITCAAGASCTYHCCGGHSCQGISCTGPGCMEGVPACP